MLPLILAGASLVAGAIGVIKGLDAKELYEKAKDIGETAERRHRRAVKEIESKRESIHQRLCDLGNRKAMLFMESGQYVVNQVKTARATANLNTLDIEPLPEENLVSIECDLKEMAQIGAVREVSNSAALAALGASGMYSAVAALASASTGTAIASLSGAAATNATLAWLGGGSLAAGGLGVVGGGWVLASVATGPALALAGFVLASEAEEAVTKAEEFAAEVSTKIAELKPIGVVLDALILNIVEVDEALRRLDSAFHTAVQYHERLLKRSESFWYKLVKKFSAERRARECAEIEVSLERLIKIFVAGIKPVIEAPVLNKEEMPEAGLKERLAHVLEVADVPPLPVPDGESA